MDLKLIIGIVVIVLVAGLLGGKPKRRKYKPKKTQPTTGKIEPAYDNESMTDLDIVYGADFKAQKIINNDEVKVYNALLKKLVYDSKKYRVFPQVNLGEILTTNPVAYRKINSKRPDFCVTDQEYMPIAIIEYHGSGHYQGNYEERDKVKQVAAEKAGLIYYAITQDAINSLESHIEKNLLPQLQNR